MDSLITAVKNILPFQNSGYSVPGRPDITGSALRKTARQFESAAIYVTGHGKNKTKRTANQ